MLDKVSVVIAGRITDYAGGFVQGTNSRVPRTFHLDNTDIRLTMPLSLGDSERRAGASLNNGPTVLSHRRLG